MTDQTTTQRTAASNDAHQGAILFRHGEPHTVLSVKERGMAAPYVRTHCPSDRRDGSTSCGDLTAISAFLVRI